MNKVAWAKLTVLLLAPLSAFVLLFQNCGQFQGMVSSHGEVASKDSPDLPRDPNEVRLELEEYIVSILKDPKSLLLTVIDPSNVKMSCLRENTVCDPELFNVQFYENSILNVLIESEGRAVLDSSLPKKAFNEDLGFCYEYSQQGNINCNYQVNMRWQLQPNCSGNDSVCDYDILFKFNVDYKPSSLGRHYSFPLKQLEIKNIKNLLFTECDSSDGLEGDADCGMARIVACELENAVGRKVWAGNQFGSCELVRCLDEFSPNEGGEGPICIKTVETCTSESEGVLTGLGTKDWMGEEYTSCHINSCTEGYHLKDEACYPNQQSCNIANGTGTQEWLISSEWQACQATTCESGYHIEGSECKQDLVEYTVTLSSGGYGPIARCRGNDKLLRGSCPSGNSDWGTCWNRPADSGIQGWSCCGHPKYGPYTAVAVCLGPPEQ